MPLLPLKTRKLNRSAYQKLALARLAFIIVPLFGDASNGMREFSISPCLCREIRIPKTTPSQCRGLQVHESCLEPHKKSENSCGSCGLHYTNLSKVSAAQLACTCR